MHVWFVYTASLWLGSIASHALVCRVPMPWNSVVRFMMAGCIGGAGLVWLMGKQYGLWTPQTFAALFGYGFLCELYIFLSTLAAYSISATLLRTIAVEGVSETDALEMYDNTRMVSARIQRLLSIGLLSDAPGGLRLTTRGAHTASRFLLLKKFFGHPAALDPDLERHRG